MIIETQRSDMSEIVAKAAGAALLGLTRIAEADGVVPVASPGQWAQFANAGFAIQASTTRAAGGAGVRHVCTSISTSFSTGANAQATALDINLRDGASGAGTVLWSKRVILPINGLWDVNLTNLNIVGSPNTAMTLEFVAAGVAGSVESVALTGYDAI